MIIEEFSIGNFRSFKEIQTLKLSAANLKSKDENIDIENIFENKGNKFLKSKAIYGANASGKSNIIHALVTFIRIIKFSVKDEDVLFLVDPFQLSSETNEEPSFFQLVFWHKDVKYRYGFEIDDKNVYAEWLFSKPNKREIPLFIREKNNITEVDNKNFSEGSKLVKLFDQENEENEIFRNNSLFLSTLASLGFGKLSKSLVEAIASIIVISGLGHDGMRRTAGDALNDDEQKKYIINFLKYGDLGIKDIENLEMKEDEESTKNSDDSKSKGKKTKYLISKRTKFNEKLEPYGEQIFSFKIHESEGTKKLFELSPFIFKALKENRPIVIDEFDARIHPLLTKKIVKLFNSSNNNNTQLIFTTHDTNLLSSDLLRRDQIEFIEKDKYGASHIYSLAEFKGVRNDSNFEKDYIRGKYGAIPFLGNFNKLIKSEGDA